VHDADGTLLGSHVARIRGRAGVVRVPGAAAARSIRASAYNAVRQRSDAIAAPVGQELRSA
jgi:hypothetical protein